MKIIHIESGLGNQMLSYCEYLALKKMNPNDKCYVETIVFDIPECNDIICQWNGYELERVFNIKAPNVKELFDDDTWNCILNEVRKCEFWKKNWNYPVHITRALNRTGLTIENIRGDFETPGHQFSNPTRLHRLKKLLKYSRIGTIIRRWYYLYTEEDRLKACDNRKRLFLATDKDIFTGQWLSFKNRGNDIELIHEDIEEAFKFPPLTDKRNLALVDYLENHNSVFIHARRGDMLSSNGWCYKYGYFRRAVKHIKKSVPNPVFVFFTNTGSINWCKSNAHVFNLNYDKDKVLFVDWNTGNESYRDMQLMSHCKHGIITNSTFGWWGTYLIKNPNKITISPELTINTTYHC